MESLEQSLGKGSTMALTDSVRVDIETVVVIGAGYAGLPLCLQLAKSGLRVTAVDVDADVVHGINQGTAKIEEDGIREFLENPEVRRNLGAQGDVTEADAFVVAVPTPLGSDDQLPELGALVSACEGVAPRLRSGNLVVLESTVPPLTTERIVVPILESSGLAVGSDILLAHCPERILPGEIMTETVENARVIGGIDDRSSRAAAQLLGRFVRGPLLLTDLRTAEFVKLIENAYRDVNIAFANQVALMCDRLEIDVAEAIALANHHPRVRILQPGIGVGGRCVPIAPTFLEYACQETYPLLQAGREVNDSMPSRTAEKILRSVEGIPEPRVVCLGAAYKANVRDIRESPALEVHRLVREGGVDAAMFDPLVPEFACHSVLEAARGSDTLAVLVPHAPILAELRTRKAEILAAMRRPCLLSFTPGIIG